MTQETISRSSKRDAAGLEVTLADNRMVRVVATIPPGHRFAIQDIPAGKFVLQYGQPIGTSLGIRQGDQITHDNMSNEVPVIRELPANLSTPPPDYIPPAERATFMGFRRPDGRVGTRNYVLIVPTSMCASHEAQQISMIAEFTLYNRQKYPNVDAWSQFRITKAAGVRTAQRLT